MSSFLKYFWILTGGERDDVYVELASEEGKPGQKGKKYILTVGSDRAGDKKLKFDNLDKAEEAFDQLYKASSSKSDVVIG